MRVKWDVSFPEGVTEVHTPHLTCSPAGSGFVCRFVHPDGSVIEEMVLQTRQDVNDWMKDASERIRKQLEEMGFRFVDRTEGRSGKTGADNRLAGWFG